MKSLTISMLLALVICICSSICHAAPDLDFWLDMEDVDLVYGDPLILEFVTDNNDFEIPEAAFCLLLELNGEFWCWPSWCSLNDCFDYDIRSIPEDRTKYWVFNTMWPDLQPAGVSATFWGAVLYTNLTKLLAPVDSVVFSF